MSKSFDGVINKIKQLEGSINQANDITELINNISVQTNLLALNAVIEAARASEAESTFIIKNEAATTITNYKNEMIELNDDIIRLSKAAICKGNSKEDLIEG
ncbi:methyl-accepting chemotaxis protein [Clostridium sp.]|uniref:methyl-accepting chemotaxis protein n=1 Tax=Clostridium sp. TaxID=1506 RepID=UPI00260189E5|nr:methyl-accepting chemotaxis protein [uncultured Clostridium sp.]